MSLVLDGVRVLEISVGEGAAIAGQHLADFGADVVLVEPAGTGHPLRHRPGAGVAGHSAVFHATMRGKRSVTAEPAGLARLMASADVLIEDVGEAGLADIGLAERPSSLVHGRLMAAADGPLAAGRPGDVADPLLQASRGFMAINGFPDRPGVRSGLPLTDVLGGVGLVQAVLAALIAREGDGQGQRVALARADIGLIATYHFGLAHLITGRDPGRFGNGNPAAEPNGVFHTADGPIQMTIAGERTWIKLVTRVLPEAGLAADPRFQTNADRVANKDVLHEIVSRAFSTRGRAHWIALMQEAGAPVGAIRDLGEAVASDEVRERGLVTQGTDGRPAIRNPVRFDRQQLDPGAPPAAGADTAAVFRDWTEQEGKPA